MLIGRLSGNRLFLGFGIAVASANFVAPAAQAQPQSDASCPTITLRDPQLYLCPPLRARQRRASHCDDRVFIDEDAYKLVNYSRQLRQLVAQERKTQSKPSAVHVLSHVPVKGLVRGCMIRRPRGLSVFKVYAFGDEVQPVAVLAASTGGDVAL